MEKKAKTTLQKVRERVADKAIKTPPRSDAKNIVWIFGTIRTGSTWLGSMMGASGGHELWNEPRIGELFGTFFYGAAAHRRDNENFIMSFRYKEIWLKSIRTFVLDAVDARYPGLTKDGCLIIKEPSGSVGAPLLAEALPESRMVLLVRDPRDMVASALDAARAGSWVYELRGNRRRRSRGKAGALADRVEKQPDRYARNRANLYLRHMGKSKEAYESHPGPKALVRYEDLRSDAFGTMKRLYSELEVPVDEGRLRRVVEEHSWERIPEGEKGEGRFHRKAEPGAWREDLTAEQARIVEEITAPLLKEFYPS